MLTNETVTKLQTMKLSGMARAYEELMRMPEANSLSVDERLGMMVDREFLDRENRGTDRRIKRAKLREKAMLEDINWRHKRGLDKNVFQSLTNCDWVRRGQNLVLVGPTGLGKTWLACALARRACSQGLTSQYLRIPRLFGQLNAARADGSYERQLSALAKTDLLIFDDWGQSLTEQERRDFREIIEDRFDKGAIIMTSQIPINRWHEIIGDPTIADAIVDRIVNRAHRIELKGDSMRKNQKEKSDA